MQTLPARGDTRAFTLIELLVVIAIIAVLAALLFPSFRYSKVAANRTICLHNMQTIGLAVLQYCGDNNQTFPSNTGPSWDAKILPYAGGGSTSAPATLMKCPADPRALTVSPTTFSRSYSLSEIRAPDNGDGIVSGATVRHLAQIERAAQTIMLVEWYSGIATNNFQYQANFGTDPGPLGNAVSTWHQIGGQFYHGANMNFCFTDGHVESLLPKETLDASRNINYWQAVTP